jgi:hypothetical protein
MNTQASVKGSGWVEFAAIVLLAVGFLRVISGISYLADSHKVNNFTFGLFGDNLWAWGLWDLAIAALALYAGWSLLSNGAFGRVVAYVWAIVVIVQGFLTLAWAPWWGAFAITLAAFVIYGLANTSDESMS